VDQIAEALNISRTTAEDIFYTIALIVGLLIARLIFLRWFTSQFEDPDLVFKARKLSSTVVFIVGVVTLAFIWVNAFGSLATYFGLLSAGIAVALGDLFKNMAAYFYILSRHPMRIGDRVELSGITGDVLDIRLFRFTVMEVGNWVHADQSTGRLVHVPNGAVFTDALHNYTEGFTHIWDEIPVQVTFESDWEKAEELMQQVIRTHSPKVESDARARIRETAKEYQIKVGHLTPIIYLSVEESGVLLTARYLVEARRRRTVNAAMWRGILESFRAEPNVSFAYPTVRTYLEGPISVSGPNVE
jgi:small-conductance mechanosensitive channel